MAETTGLTLHARWSGWSAIALYAHIALWPPRTDPTSGTLRTTWAYCTSGALLTCRAAITRGTSQPHLTLRAFRAWWTNGALVAAIPFVSLCAGSASSTRVTSRSLWARQATRTGKTFFSLCPWKSGRAPRTGYRFPPVYHLSPLHPAGQSGQLDRVPLSVSDRRLPTKSISYLCTVTNAPQIAAAHH